MSDEKKLRTILYLCKRYFGDNILYPARRRRIVYARAVFYKLCREFTNVSYREMAHTFNKDHATAVHGIKLFNNNVLFPEDYERYEAIKTILAKEFHYDPMKERLIEEMADKLRTLSIPQLNQVAEVIIGQKKTA